MTTAQISSQLELLRLNTGAPLSRVATAVTMAKRELFQYQGAVSAALVLGGVDATGPHLYSIYPHGSTDKLPFTSMGSGSLAAMSVLESRYHDDMSEAEAMSVVEYAIRGGVFNDLGSGSNVDLCKVALPPTAFRYPVGSFPIVKERVEVFAPASASAQQRATGGGDAMEVESR